MKKLLKRLAARLRSDERGLTTVEYLILLCLISALAVGTWQKFGSKVQGNLNTASDTIEGNIAPAASGQPQSH
jgi:Flp pilus assembly pilin Flp